MFLDDRFHKDNLVYVACDDDRWPMDDLRERTLPEKTTVPNLKEALKISEQYELGEGLLPVRNKLNLVAGYGHISLLSTFLTQTKCKLKIQNNNFNVDAQKIDLYVFV